MSDKLDRLPRWARDEIVNSRRNIAHLEEEIRVGITNPVFPHTNLHVPVDRVGAEWAPSAFHSGRIMLGPDWNDYVDFRFENYAGQPRVYVSAGWSSLIVRPRAGNTLHLTMER